jgi:hypothetical protein
MEKTRTFRRAFFLAIAGIVVVGAVSALRGIMWNGRLKTESGGQRRDAAP